VIAMTCAEFETALAELLASPSHPGEPAVSRLRAHASSCHACAGAGELVTLAATPAGHRDPIADPGPAYWKDFETRLAEKIARERRSSRRRFGVGAAAVIAAGLVSVVLLRRDPPVHTPEVPFPQETPAVADAGTGTMVLDEDPSLDFAGAEPIDTFDDDDSQLFPAAEALSADDAKRLLDWLAQEETKTKRGSA
jgi:hypothetical protein